MKRAFLILLCAIILVLPVAASAAEEHSKAACDAMNAYSNGCASLESGRWTAAIEYFGAMTLLEPYNAEAHRMLGVAHFRQGDRTAAMAAWKRSSELDPKGDVGNRARLAAARCSLDPAFGGLSPADPLLEESDYERFYRPVLARLPTPDDERWRESVSKLLAAFKKTCMEMAFLRAQCQAAQDEWDRVAGTSDAVSIRLAATALEELRRRVSQWRSQGAELIETYRQAGLAEAAQAVARLLEETPSAPLL